jgi:putative endonuclease
MPWVYILKNSNEKYYIGSAVDLKLRMKQHNGGHTHSTARMGELQLASSQEFDTLKEARYIEKRLKKFKRHDYIEKVVKDGYVKILPR